MYDNATTGSTADIDIKAMAVRSTLPFSGIISLYDNATFIDTRIDDIDQAHQYMAMLSVSRGVPIEEVADDVYRVRGKNRNSRYKGNERTEWFIFDRHYFKYNSSRLLDNDTALYVFPEAEAILTDKFYQIGRNSFLGQDELIVEQLRTIRNKTERRIDEDGANMPDEIIDKLMRSVEEGCDYKLKEEERRRNDSENAYRRRLGYPERDYELEEKYADQPLMIRWIRLKAAFRNDPLTFIVQATLWLMGVWAFLALIVMTVMLIIGIFTMI